MVKNCLWDYPEWEEDLEKSSEKWIVPIAPELCIWCDYIYACKVKVTIALNTWFVMSDTQLEDTKKNLTEDDIRDMSPKRILN